MQRNLKPISVAEYLISVAEYLISVGSLLACFEC